MTRNVTVHTVRIVPPRNKFRNRANMQEYRPGIAGLESNMRLTTRKASLSVPKKKLVVGRR